MDKPDANPKPVPKPPPQMWRGVWYVLIGLFVVALWQQYVAHYAVRTIPYSEFKQHLAAREVADLSIKGDEIDGRLVPTPPAPPKPAPAPPAAPAPNTDVKPAEAKPTEAKPAEARPAEAKPAEAKPAEAKPAEAKPATPAKPDANPVYFRTVRVEDPDLVKEMEAADVTFEGTRPSAFTEIILTWVLPIALMFLLWSWLGRRMGAARESILSIGKSNARLAADENTGVSFSDVAGCDEAKQELKEIVDFLRSPERYQRIGARIPKGVLLVGPPGTGKTLLARAVAGEAKVPFYSITGSDFVEMFVGVGAARVRDLFREAKKNAPCIIFIDELDAIGRQRGVHIGAVNDEREQTLNALLAEMDGFEANNGVIMLSATNRPEVLDRALLRPGRFDRQVVVDAPDLDGREAILKVHARDKKLAAGVDLRRLAAGTAGFSGADLANVLNEAALLAGRRQEREISQAELEEAVEKVVAGPERKSRRLNETDKNRVAYHEVGHALVAAYSPHADPVHKISVVPRGRAALGYTMQLPAEDQFLLTHLELVERLRGMLGGRAAEEVALGEISTGAQNDLERATALARQMIASYGMSERLGLAHCALPQSRFLAGPEFQMQRDCSEATAREIDEEVKKLLDEAYAEAKAILTEHRDQLDAVRGELLRRETIEGADFYKMIGRPRPQPKEPAPPLPEPDTPEGAAYLPNGHHDGSAVPPR